MKRALLVWLCCFVAVFFFDGKGHAGTVSRDAELRFRMLSQEQEHAPVPFPRSQEAPRMLSAGQELDISVILPCGQSVFLPPGHTTLHTLSLKPEVLSGLETSGAKRKHPGLGILLSALVPGLGEFYAGSWLRGIAFLGVEAALWTSYAHFSGEGQDYEDTFHDYAETHWDETRWRIWMQQHPEFGDTTHSLPSTRTQQYYEMIGKYNQFKGGWDDYLEGGPSLTENRDYYENLRDKSNDNFKTASYCAMITLGNRILSVFDTAWTIRGHNRKLESALRMDLRRRYNKMSPCLSLSMRW